MDIIKKHIARRERMNDAEEKLHKAMRAMKSSYCEKVARDKKADADLLKRCIVAFHAIIEDEHECKCCQPNYPLDRDCHLDDEGNFHAFFDADHPNDCRDVEMPIAELLERAK